MQFTTEILGDISEASLVAQTVKESACNAGEPLGWEDPLEKGMATHSNILAWGIPWTEEPGGPQSMGLKRVRHEWATFTCTPSSSHRRRPLSRRILWCLGFQILETSSPQGDIESESWLTARQLRETGAQCQSHSLDSAACLHNTQQYIAAHTHLHNIHMSTAAGER